MNKDGVYIYLPGEHAVGLIKPGDARSALSRAAPGQRFVAEAPVSIVITAVCRRTSARYGERAGGYVHMEAGHAAQNIHLAAVSLGLGSVPMGAFNDGDVKDVLDLPEDHEPLYIIPAGFER